MSWCAVEVQAPAGAREAVAGWLVAQTGQAVEERDNGSLVAWLAGRRDADGLLAGLRSTFGPQVDGRWKLVPEVDWSDRWRQGLGPRRIGRLVITPSWCEPPASDVAPIVIDPETAFGTGEHGSTRTALALLDHHLRPGHRVLDLGSGSGILAIAAARLGASRVTGIELDAETEPVAAANVTRNGVAATVTLITGDAALLAPLLGPVEVVVSNILRTVNAAMLPVIRAALAPDGVAILAGMEEPERDAFLPVLEAGGFQVVEEAVDGGWWGVAARVG